MEVTGLGVEFELQLLAYTTAMATPDPSSIHNLCHYGGNARSLTHWVRPGIECKSSWRLCRVLNLLSHNGNFPLLTLNVVVPWCHPWPLISLTVPSALIESSNPRLGCFPQLHYRKPNSLRGFSPQTQAKNVPSSFFSKWFSFKILP